jgi:hypothetical protein
MRTGKSMLKAESERNAIKLDLGKKQKEVDILQADSKIPLDSAIPRTEAANVKPHKNKDNKLSFSKP